MDGISVDVIKAGGRVLATRLHTTFIEIWEEEQTVEDWFTVIIIRLFKNKGDKRYCGNCRGISLLPVASKVFSRLVLNRVQKYLGTQIMEQQAGFLSNRSTIDNIFALKLLMEKTRDYNKPLSCVSLIYKKPTILLIVKFYGVYVGTMGSPQNLFNCSNSYTKIQKQECASTENYRTLLILKRVFSKVVSHHQFFSMFSLIL